MKKITETRWETSEVEDQWLLASAAGIAVRMESVIGFRKLESETLLLLEGGNSLTIPASFEKVVKMFKLEIKRGTKEG